MQVTESISMAFDSMKTNKLRSTLTLIGISIGLFSIIIVMTAISGVQKSVEDTFNSIGTTNFIIQKYPAIRMGHGSHRKYRNREDLTIAQGERLRKMTSLPTAVGIQLVRGSQTVKFGNNKTNPDVPLVGLNADQLAATDRYIEFGRSFSNQDLTYARNVCLIGYDIASKLFGALNPVGQEVRINDLKLEVIGIIDKKGNILGQSQDNFVVIPLALYEKLYGDRRSASYTITAPNQELLEATKSEVIGALRTIRKVKPGQDNDFEIITNDQLIDQFNDVTKYFKLGAGIIAFIALIAAGVGIMNIMLVSVTERTKEIGIRKAIGAKKKVIRTQFVIEAIVLSQIGGVFGILLGLLGGNMVAVTLGVSVVFPMDWILIGLLVTTFVGVVFGVYPAVKASNLDPIEALRYE
jgi:putative ABC transport system permease protein